MRAKQEVAEVALPVPLRRSLDYLLPSDIASLAVGARVVVPLGRRSSIGVVTALKQTSEIPSKRLRAIAEVLDSESLFSPALLALLQWAAEYYHHPIGEVVAAALPARLRTRAGFSRVRALTWRVTALGASVDPATIKRAAVQRHVLVALQGAAQTGMAAQDLAEVSARWRTAVDALVSRHWVVTQDADTQPRSADHQVAPELTDAQAIAVRTVLAADGFASFLLHGVTGSGKTEVYICIAEQLAARGEQVLVLVPEIGLTPQLVARFHRRFDGPLAILHSGLTDRERADAWLAARSGDARIVVGTRSAVFTPLPRLGAIIVDEEHDSSYAQQDRFRYSARDVAIMRAKLEAVPIVLGSATPSLETLNRVRRGDYAKLALPNRAGGAELPAIELLDMRRLAEQDGLSRPLCDAIASTLEKREQSLLFLNRRGFAPVWMCFACGWVAGCDRCDARFTFHRAAGRLRCHHCGSERTPPDTCPECRVVGLHAFGEGTERVESALVRIFPGARILRIDRDSTRSRGSLEDKLERARLGEADILIGTQMLSKGHDFPNVTLVGVINADQGLYGSDFRAAERLVQQIVQVSGRAGRAMKSGRVLIQTYHPGHPVFAALKTDGYERFADYALEERRQAGFPPFSHFALLRAESTKPQAALAFLRDARARACGLLQGGEVQVMEPVPSPMERRAGRYRAQLLVQSSRRKPLHAMLDAWLERLDAEKSSKRVRWSIDVDPIDML